MECNSYSIKQERIMGRGMRRTLRGLLLLAVIGVSGCTDGVRQTVIPYLVEGLTQITTGLFQGLEEQLYPENDDTSNS
jgi:hypothetical protein